MGAAARHAAVANANQCWKEIAMRKLSKLALALAVAAVAGQAAAQIVFYEQENFRGRSFSTASSVEDLRRFGFNDRASSVEVIHERWEVCDNSRFTGRCILLRPGRYPSLASMAMNDRLSSVREIARGERYDESRYAPVAPLPVYDARRREGEQLFTAEVLAVHAVVGPPQQRCWMEREQVVQNQSQPNIGGAVAGALIGGILGHQVGGGMGKDLATAGGLVAGATIGANAGRDSPVVTTQNVQRCTTVSSQSPDFWDVTYSFRGLEHHVQMTSPPGATIVVNALGEPRV
jgi:uncharacterized protein YcfJ